ncbi:N-succinylarginine dihydrolase, partial [Acinetobacter baumannii]|uniref:N-succinylarginine dihydrolase n=1 Tax=Acinetobacter baumannii TaxID=470 RepID=UPI00227D13B5
MTAREVNVDGLPGLTHRYAGLSFGNEASTRHRYRVSNPQLAAKQGLKKMTALADAGYPQPQAYVTLSDPLINVAFVLVARGSAPDQHLLTRSARIA